MKTSESGNINNKEETKSSASIKDSVFKFFRIFQCKSQDRSSMDMSHNINIDKPPLVQKTMTLPLDSPLDPSLHSRKEKMNKIKTQKLSSLNFNKNETILDEST